jgi:hypothetical protein
MRAASGALQFSAQHRAEEHLLRRQQRPYFLMADQRIVKTDRATKETAVGGHAAGFEQNTTSLAPVAVPTQPASAKPPQLAVVAPVAGSPVVRSERCGGGAVSVSLTSRPAIPLCAAEERSLKPNSCE